ncbi:MAG TPA: hypothetical protein VF681_12790 [Abditibacteriaceae bacterium]|jgi:hypothetical protein
MKNYVHFRTAAPASRFVAFAVAASFAVPMLAGCGGQQAQAPMDQPRNSQMPRPVGAPNAQQGGGMSTRNKVILLAGAAALYYMYKKRQNAQGQSVQYYQSKNGRIYYRDPKTKQAIWVTQAPQIQVPANEAQEYSGYQGYNNQNTGREFGGYRDGGFYVPAQ